MSQSFQLDDWEVHASANTLKRQQEVVKLEPKMMNVLAYLAEHAGQVISAEQLLIEFWRGTFYGDAPVQKCIAMLRKKLGDNPRQPHYIETVQRRGYRVIAKVQYQDERYRWATSQVLERWTQGSPYLGLQSFQPQHAPVFFGRNKAIAEVVHKLAGGLTAHFPFLLLIGKSGSGKSSLLRAGLIPFLTRAEGLAGIKVRDVRIITPQSGREGDVFRQLFAALEEMKLLADNWLYDVHAAQLFADPTLWPRFLRSQPEPDTTIERQPALLVFDQFEQLLQQDSLAAADLACLTALLNQLIRQQGLIVIMALRNDFYANSMEVDGFAALKEEGQQYDLPPSAVADIARMIRLPALAAGLSFDEDPDSGQKLDEVLLQAAAGHTDVLPLLEFTLELLYQRRSRDNRMLFSAYHNLGGLEGAIARQAENTFQSLPGATQACWDSVMHQLVSVKSRSQVLLAAQKVPLAQFPEPQQRLFIERFVDARLFVVASADSQDSCVCVAHEALLKHWHRVTDWAQQNREALLKHTQLSADCERWLSEGRPNDMLLSSGKKVREAMWIASLPQLHLTDIERSFIRLSGQRQARARRYRMAAIAGLVVLSISATGLSLYANNQTQIAQRKSQQAEVLRYKAEQLLSFMLGELRGQLEPIGKLDILEGVGKKTLEYYAGLDAPDRLSEANSLKLLAEISVSRGDYGSGQAQLQQALALLSSSDSNTEDAVLLRGNLYYWLGLIAYYQGEHATVLPLWQQYLGAAQQLLARAPDNKAWQIEVSSAQHNLGALALKLEDYPLAHQYFLGSLEIERQILAQAPDKTEAKRALRSTLLWQSDVALNLLDISQAKALASDAVTLTLSYATAEPDNFGYQFELLSAYNVLLNYLLLSGDSTALAQTFAQAVPVASALSARDLDNESWNIKVATLLAYYFDYELLEANSVDSFASQARQLTARTYPRLKHVPSQQRLYSAMLLAKRKNRNIAAITGPPPASDYHPESSPKFIAEFHLSCLKLACTTPLPELPELPVSPGRSVNSRFANAYGHLLKRQPAEAQAILTQLAQQGIGNAHLQDVLTHFTNQALTQGKPHEKHPYSS